MKYFAKWIPVEGEIKVGEIMVDKITKERMKAPFDTDESNTVTKVQLSLCSRDVQVGDNVHFFEDTLFLHMDNTEVWVTSKDILGVLDIKDDTITIVIRKLHGTGKSGGRCSREELFKVIGSISPEAKWVKEGDEFEESGVELIWVPKDSPHPIHLCGYVECGPLQNPDSYIKLARLKGPCGHFH